MKTIEDALKHADTFDSPHTQHMSIVMLAAEVRRLRDEVNGLTGSLDRAEKALKEAQQQPAVAWMIHEYQGTGEKRLQFQPHIPSIRDDVTGPIVTALYARPVPAAPVVAVPAVPDQFCDVTKLIVPQEWRDVITELADDLSIELDMRYQSRSHYPSELRKYENEMQPVYRARSLLQSADHSELAIEKVAPDCRACAILPCSCK